MDGKISKTFLFQQCVLYRHSIALHFLNPIQIGSVKYDYVILQDFANQSEKDLLLKAVLGKIDLYGTFYGVVFLNGNNPYETIQILLNTENIAEIEIRQ